MVIVRWWTQAPIQSVAAHTTHRNSGRTQHTRTWRPTRAIAGRRAARPSSRIQHLPSGSSLVCPVSVRLLARRFGEVPGITVDLA